MNKFRDAMSQSNNITTTLNGMGVQKSSNNAVVDLFYAAGASRGQNLVPQFNQAAIEDLDLAVRVMLYARDAREGMGERKVFRDVMTEFARNDYANAARVLPKIAELGRFDDLFAFVDTPLENEALKVFAESILDGNGLAAKWAPREKSAKKALASKLRNILGLSAKEYRKLLADNTDVVERDMCEDNWNAINYSHVPSVASARYQKAFSKHDAIRYGEYLASLEKGVEGVKINAGAVYPYDVAKSVLRGVSRAAEQQWNALPDWIPNDKSFLPVIDVSGSMQQRLGDDLTAMDVSVSLGLYCAQRAKGALKDSFLTFSQHPQWQDVSGLSLKDSMNKIRRSEWGYNTDLEAVFYKLLGVAVQNRVPQSDMPEFIIIISDMQFDQGVSASNVSAQRNIEEQYTRSGYEVPKLVYWNVVSYGRNTPVEFDKNGVALVSGFSPALMKSVLSLNVESFTPINVVKDAVMKERYDW